jgi:hypothetical protein
MIQAPEDLVPEFQKKPILLLPSCSVYGDGFTSDRIVNILKENYRDKNNDTN